MKVILLKEDTFQFREVEWMSHSEVMCGNRAVTKADKKGLFPWAESRHLLSFIPIPLSDKFRDNEWHRKAFKRVAYSNMAGKHNTGGWLFNGFTERLAVPSLLRRNTCNTGLNKLRLWTESTSNYNLSRTKTAVVGYNSENVICWWRTFASPLGRPIQSNVLVTHKWFRAI